MVLSETLCIAGVSPVPGRGQSQMCVHRPGQNLVWLKSYSCLCTQGYLLAVLRAMWGAGDWTSASLIKAGALFAMLWLGSVTL